MIKKPAWQITPATVADLKKIGFTEAPSEVLNRRIVMNAEGKDKEGKTDFALSGKPPIIYFEIDTGGESVYEKFVATGKKVYVYRTRIIKTSEGEGEWQNQWNDLRNAALTAWGLPEGTVVFDTWGEVYELVRLITFGRLEKIPSYQYGDVNRIMRELDKAAFASRMSTVFIHKMKPIYANDKRTNEYELAGWSDITYEVQVNARPFCEADEDGNTVFKVLIRNCRPNARMSGKVYELGRAGDPPDKRRLTLEGLIEMMYAKPRKLVLDDEGDDKPKEKKSRKLVLED